ncbi:hypothetical protein D3C80_1619100 [compost metagenome]
MPGFRAQLGQVGLCGARLGDLLMPLIAASLVVASGLLIQRVALNRAVALRFDQRRAPACDADHRAPGRHRVLDCALRRRGDAFVEAGQRRGQLGFGRVYQRLHFLDIFIEDDLVQGRVAERPHVVGLVEYRAIPA